MSYILDALQRADAERGRGQVPGLHTPTAPRHTPPGIAPARNTWVWAAVAGALVVAGAAAWWVHHRTASAPAAAPDTPPTAASPAAPAAPAPPAPALAAPSPAALPLLTPPPTPAPPPSPPRATAVPSRDASAPPAPTPAAAQAPAAVRPWADLSPEVRAQLPAVNISGSTYSQNPALRMLITNGKVVQEGHEIAPGVVLESIGPRSAVLSHRSVRYSVPY